MSIQAQDEDLATTAAAQSEVPLLPESASEVIDRSDANSHSYPSSACITPLPTKKLNPPESDAGTDLLPVCRICQLPGDKEDFLFSPCRCSGTMMFVHYLCLLKWIEVSSRRTKKPPKCELCHFQYIRHKRFKFHHWRLPRVSSRDKCLHVIFLINLLIMVSCAVATILCFLSDKGHLDDHPQARHIVLAAGKAKPIQLSMEEIITLTCGVMFFVSFFIAMTVEIKARHTVYRLFCRFLSHNTEWQIEPYEKEKDVEGTNTQFI